MCVHRADCWIFTNTTASSGSGPPASFDKFLDLVLPGEDAKRVVDRRGDVLLDKPGSGKSAKPEVSRRDLRRLLMQSLPSDTIRWGHKLTKAGRLHNGQYRLTFADGSSA